MTLMTARYFLIASFCLLSLGCARNDTKEKAPISSDVMEQILFDLQVADVYSTMVQPDSLPPVNVKNKDSLAQYYSDILAHYKLTEEELRAAMRWYEEHPAELEAIFGRLQSRFTELGEQLK
jgi:hypothetical protein